MKYKIMIIFLMIIIVTHTTTFLSNLPITSMIDVNALELDTLKVKKQFKVGLLTYEIIDVKNKKVKVIECDKNAILIDIPKQVTIDQEYEYVIECIGEEAFNGCINLQKITIPNSIVYIEKKAFNSCCNLKQIVIPNSVKSIGEEAFSLCDNLEYVSLSNKLTSIEIGTFAFCTKLKNIEIPNSVINIGDFAFGRCKSLRTLLIPNSVKNIHKDAFGEEGSYINLTLYVYSDSYAEKYAKNNKINYIIDISNMSVSGIKASYTYNGKAQKPTVTITGLKAGTDYTVTYSNNTSAGKATVRITGQGNYVGTITKTFTIA